MGMKLVRGRAFERGEAAPSVIVNETFVRKVFPAEDPIGRRVRFSADREAPWFTIVGIAADARVRGARGETRVETFIPYWQFVEPGMNVILKAHVDAAQLAPALKQAVAGLDPNVPVAGIAVLSDTVAESIDQPRFFAVLAVGFAGLALVLAAIGIYGVMAYAVAQRTTEIGVRMALGATRRHVIVMVLLRASMLMAAGIVVGAAVAWWFSAGVKTFLFEVEPNDVRIFAAALATLAAAGLLASAVPARRAASVDPMIALRQE
jgi:putative ABC transport system permease protein